MEYINILILLIFLIHMIPLIHLIFLRIVKSINSINSINNTRVSTVFLDTLENIRVTAPAYAGALCWLPSGLPGRSIKTARFLADKWLQSGLKCYQLVTNNAIQDYDKNHYQDRRFSSTPIFTLKRMYQFIYDLIRGQVETDNFWLVQGCKPIMALLALSAMVGNTHINLTAAIVRGLRMA